MRQGWRLLAALFLFMSSACALAAVTDPIPHLLSADYAEVERIMQAVQDDYKRDVITDEELLFAFRPFYHIDPSQAQHLDRWIERYPKSYVAHVARGVYYKGLGYHRPRYNSKDTKRTAMAWAHAIAVRDLYASIELDDKPLLSYFHSIDLADRIGRRPKKRLLSAANAIDPDNFIVRQEFLLSLRPSQGGSLEEMRAYVEDSKTVLPPERIRRMESTVMVAQIPASLRRGENPAEGERRYRQVLEFDPGNYSARWYLLYALVNQKKCTEAIAEATTLLQEPDARAAEITAKRGWCYFRENRIAEGVADYRRAAELGDVPAQKDLAGMYWYGKHVPEDVDSARHWLRKAAEQGDADAQRDLQQGFGVTIDTSPPATFPQWLKSVLIGAGVVLLFVFMAWLEYQDNVAAASGNGRLLRYSRSHLFAGVVGGGLFGFLAWEAFWDAYQPWRSEVFLFLTVLTIVALYLIVQYLTVRHELLADGVLVRRLGGREVRLKWADVRSIRYVTFVKWFRLESTSGDVGRVSDMIIGLQPFARAVLVHAEQAIDDEDTRETLEGMAADWAALDSEAPDEAERG